MKTDNTASTVHNSRFCFVSANIIQNTPLFTIACRSNHVVIMKMRRNALGFLFSLTRVKMIFVSFEKISVLKCVSDCQKKGRVTVRQNVVTLLRRGN